mmetsp:Transcript_2035/g.7445  ORF Transcript_2035/g.7445 Transcript_2035/m.7445 type:complete len:244 (-) Transcript_2035:181-912(-)
MSAALASMQKTAGRTSCAGSAPGSVWCSTTRCTISALPAPLAAMITLAALLMTGRVSVTRLAGGLGEVVTGRAIPAVAAVSGRFGKRLATWPSSPMPRTTTSNAGRPASVRGSTSAGCERSFASYMSASCAGWSGGSLMPWTLASGTPSLASSPALAAPKLLSGDDAGTTRSSTTKKLALLQSTSLCAAKPSSIVSAEPPLSATEHAPRAPIAAPAASATCAHSPAASDPSAYCMMVHSPSSP